MKWFKEHAGYYTMQAPHGQYAATKMAGPGGGKYWVVTLNGLRIVGHTHRTLREAKQRAQDHNTDYGGRP